VHRNTIRGCEARAELKELRAKLMELRAKVAK
jgi:hypothetical protein